MGSCVATREVLSTAAIVALGMVLVAVLGKESGLWFAVSALIAVAVSTFMSLFFAPAAYLSRKTASDAKPVKDGYVGAKKTSKKEKKVYEAKVVEEAPPVAAPVEEAEEAVEETEEEVTEEVEETVEETEEAPAEEEAPVEATEEAEETEE